MTTSKGQAVEFRIPQEPLLPVPAMDDLGPIPSLGSDGESFVVIRSAADLDELFEDNISMLQENKQLVQQELAQVFESTHLQPSLKSANIVKENKPSTSKESPYSANQSNTANQRVLYDQKDSFHSTIVSLPNGLDPLKKVNNEMNQSCLPAMPPQPQQIHPVLGVDESESLAISIVSFSPNDFGSEEIQAKVTQLIDENMHLKDTIIQNNLSLKAQYDRIVAWKNDVTKVHKEKVREANECIEALKEENAAIKRDNDNLRSNLHIQQTEHAKTKKLLTDTSENNLKGFQLDIANKKIQEMNEEIKNVNLKIEENQASYNWKAMEEKLQLYETELEQAYKKLSEMEKGTEERENFALQIQIQLKQTKEKLLLAEMTAEQNNKEMYSLRNQLARNLKTSEERVQLIAELEQTKNNLLMSEMANEQAKKEMFSLMNKLASNQKTSDSTSRFEEAYAQVVAERNQLNEELESRNSTILTSQSIIKKLEEDLDKANNAVQECQKAVQTLQKKEEQATINAWMTTQRMNELVEEKQQNPPDLNPGELSYLRQQLMQSQKALKQSEQNRAVSDAQVRTLNNQIAELGRQLQNQLVEGDYQLFAMKTQLDVYKADFDAEREANEGVKREKNKVAEDLLHLQRRNQQLQQESEILREQLRKYGGVPTGHWDFRCSTPEATAPSRDEFAYECPKCKISFSTLNAAENHVARCRIINDSFP